MKLEVEDLKKINLLPGETIVATFERSLPSTAIQAFLIRFNKLFPNNKLLIIPKEVEIYKIISEVE